MVKNLPANVEGTGDMGSIPQSGRFLEGEIVTHSNILVWKNLWTEEPGGLQSMGSQRVGQDLATEHTIAEQFFEHTRKTL